MTALEQDIIDKFNQLDPQARRRVMAHIQHIADVSFDAAEWWRDIEAVQADMRERLGDNATTGILDILYELREAGE